MPHRVSTRADSRGAKKLRVCKTIADMRQVAADLKSRGDLGFVPTMGALHAGHMALVELAVRENAGVAASIFVNPTQFGDPEDFDKYPNTLDADLTMLEQAGVEAVFLPDVSVIYPPGDETIVETTKLANMLHGEVRPGHFRGVTTVVTRLFNIVQPHRAYFGKKDYQQLAVIRRMVSDLHIPVEIRGVETVRDADGLALSSRNVRLTPEQRRAAAVLNAALTDAEEAIRGGADLDAARRVIRERIGAAPLARLQAIDIVDAATFEPVEGRPNGMVGIMVSALFGDVLLIDQREVTP